MTMTKRDSSKEWELSMKSKPERKTSLPVLWNKRYKTALPIRNWLDSQHCTAEGVHRHLNYHNTRKVNEQWAESKWPGGHNSPPLKTQPKKQQQNKTEAKQRETQSNSRKGFSIKQGEREKKYLTERTTRQQSQSKCWTRRQLQRHWRRATSEIRSSEDRSAAEKHFTHAKVNEQRAEAKRPGGLNASIG